MARNAALSTESAEHWIGETSEKPTTGVFPGSTFYEWNTGQRWIHNGKQWVEDLSLIYALSQVIK